MAEPDLSLLQADEPASLDRLAVESHEAEEKFLAIERLQAEAVRSHEEEKEFLENERLQAEIDDLVQDRDQRRTYANRLFWLIAVWLVVIGLIVLLHGFSHVPFTLSGAVLTTLIGSTTASVLGLFAIVANYLFPKR